MPKTCAIPLQVGCTCSLQKPNGSVSCTLSAMTFTRCRELAAVRADANASLKEAAERITLMRDVEARRNGDMDKVQREIDRNAREKQLIDSQIELVKKRKELAKELEQ